MAWRRPYRPRVDDSRASVRDGFGFAAFDDRLPNVGKMLEYAVLESHSFDVCLPFSEDVERC